MSAMIVMGCLCVGCTVGPDYQRPAAPVAVTYKELAGWKPAMPMDLAPRGEWWRVYNDPVLNGLMARVAIDNQNVRAFEAAFRAAQARVRVADSLFYPTVGLSLGATYGSNPLQVRGGAGRVSGEFAPLGRLDWAPDLWGRVRRTVESATAEAQVSEADLAGATLSAQATLATSYFLLRGQDAMADVLAATVQTYRRAVSIARDQYGIGLSSQADVLIAQAQLDAARAQLAGIGAARAQYEHAIAVLIGQTPDQLTLAPGTLAVEAVVIPPDLPSTLLERRPDIAAAERAVAAQNARIGVAIAGYYPTISLSALGGFVGNPIGQLFNAANSIWSLGAIATETVFAGGRRGAEVDAARATYDAVVADYRQTVLTAFQQVEDQLAALRVYEEQAEAQKVAIASARKAVDGVQGEFRAGFSPYTDVVVQQQSLLAQQLAAIVLQQNRLVASVALIEALGGGWTAPFLAGPGVAAPPAAPALPRTAAASTVSAKPVGVPSAALLAAHQAAGASAWHAGSVKPTLCQNAAGAWPEAACASAGTIPLRQSARAGAG